MSHDATRSRKKRPRVTAAACNRMQHEIRKTVPSSRRSRVVALESPFASAPHHRSFAKRTQFPPELPTSPELPASPELPLLGRALRADTHRRALHYDAQYGGEGNAAGGP